MTDIQSTILRTLSYFAINHYPMTAFEIWKWQLRPKEIYAFEEVHQAIQEMHLNHHLGFYTLPKHDIDLYIEMRKRRYLFAIRKYKKLRPLAAYLASLNDVEAAAICNTRLPFHFAPDESDIDIFIVSRKGKAWSTRLSSLLPLRALRLRPGEVEKDAFDLSFIADNANLAFENIAIKDDIYLASWILSLQPLFDKTGMMKRIAERNPWTRSYFPNKKMSIRPTRQSASSKLQLFSPFSESMATSIQQRNFTKTIQEGGDGIIIHEGMLKMHTKDARVHVKKSYQALCESIGIAS